MLIFTIFCQIVLVLTAGDLDLVMGVIVFLFFVLGIAYSCPAFSRLKRNFLLGSMVEGSGAFLCLLAGGTQYGPPLNKWFLPYALLFAVGFMFASNIKDYKDFKGDLECNITTFYVYMYRKGWAVEKTNIVVSSILSFILLIPSLLLFLLGLHAGIIFVACVLALIPGVLMACLPPRTAVNFSLICITIYFLFLVKFYPGLSL
jgi:4-hydroxybenzoate polyprenyltransferase